ncbi:unnamed protein product [Rhizoctonia solani]|uniref:Terpene synthase n=1 Tax=Rhizoctonia solani TaxID=456999 RepID=A0A8H3C3X4_9AGAM|nr:unnamed protein product [Rhizoctonia solani]
MTSTTFITQFTVPDIATYTGKYFESKCNPHIREAEASAHAWFDSYGIYSGVQREKFFQSRFCLLAALCYPEADLEHIRPAMDFFLWTFAFDDMADIGEFCSEGLKRAVDITMHALRDPNAALPDLKIVATLQSYVNRMRLNGGPRAIQHLIEALDDYHREIIRENIRMADNCVETIEEYITARRETSGVRQTLAMLEYAHCLDLPDIVFHHPVVRELATAGGEILAWANDIYSFPAEHSHDQLHNFVYVVMHNKKVDLQGAVDYVYQRIQTRVQEYVALKAQLPSFGPHLDNQVSQYIKGIEYVVQGCIEWYFITPRYLGSDAKEVKGTGVVKLRTPLKASQIVVA